MKIFHVSVHKKVNLKNQNWLKYEQCDNISDRYGDWEKHKVYDTENEANTALDGFFVQSEEVTKEG